MLKIKSSYTLLFCLLCGINLLSAQNQEEDKLIFKALQDELIKMNCTYQDSINLSLSHTHSIGLIHLKFLLPWGH